MEQTLQPKSFQEQRLQQLFDECRNSVIGQIIGPFGLSMAMFDDKDGGGVNTVHNVRKGVYATDKEKEEFNNRGKYESKDYHEKNSNYQKKREASKDAQEAETLKNVYTGENISREASEQLAPEVEHVISAKEIHDDPGRVLSELDGSDLANSDSNLHLTTKTTNASKGDSSVSDYTKRLKETQEERRNRIDELSKKSNLSDDEKKQLVKLQEQEKYDADLAAKVDKDARQAYNKTVNKKYYASPKFIKSVAKDAGTVAIKTAMQQALGSVLIEFAQAVFHEMKMFIKERSEAAVNIFEDIKFRLKRIMQRVLDKLSQWKEIAADLRDGLLSGFLSSLTTILVNIFATTAKRFVRAIREGIRSLIQAFKILFFRPAEMTEEDAIKIVIKSLSGVFITTISIAVESGLNTFLQTIPFIGQFASIITPVLLGILSGISIAIISYYMDKVFHLFALSEEKFRQLCAVGDLQSKYSQLLHCTANNIIAMGSAYSEIIKRNNEILENNENTHVSQRSSIILQEESISHLNEAGTSLILATDSIMKISRTEFKHELDENSNWFANRRKEKEEKQKIMNNSISRAEFLPPGEEERECKQKTTEQSEFEAKTPLILATDSIMKISRTEFKHELEENANWVTNIRKEKETENHE